MISAEVTPVQKRLQPEDIYRVETIGSPAIAPDGEAAVYVRTSYDRDKKKKHNQIYLTSRERERPLTAGPTDSAPAWCPDGKAVAFVSGRTDKPQIHLIPIDGGEAKHLETEKKPTAPLVWSPDGKKIAFKAVVERSYDGPRYPGEPDDLVKSEDEDEDREKDKDKRDDDAPRVITDLHYRTDMDGFIHDRRPQIFLVDTESGETTQLTDAFRNHGEMTWHPDGVKLAYTVRHYDERRVVYTTSVREVDTATGAHEKILDWDGSISAISYSPDHGEWLVMAATENRDPMGTAITHLWALSMHDRALPASTEEVSNLTPDLDRSVMGRFHWNPEGTSLLFTLGDRGKVGLHRTEFADGKPVEVQPMEAATEGVISDLDVAARAGTLLYKAEDFTHPEQLFMQDSEGHTQLSNVNEELLAEFDMLPAETFTYRGPDDWEIQGWLVRPAGYEEGRRYPAVLSIHGGPTGAYMDRFDLNFQMLAQQGFAVVFTNPRGSITYGTRFAQGVVRDWGGKDYQDIMAGLDVTIDMGVVDPDRVGVMGWSYGGYMTCWTVTQTDRFAAAVAGANISNIYTLWGESDIAVVYNQALCGAPAFDDEEQYMGRSAMRHVRNVQTPVLILHGEADVRTPMGQSEQFFAALKRLRKEVVFVRYPGQHHGFANTEFVVDRWQRTLGWFEHHLRGSCDD